MKCPKCGSKRVKREKWSRVKNWETATCKRCGFEFDYDADQLES